MKFTTFLLLWLLTFAMLADERLPQLFVKGEIYSNVTVTAVSATDIFFTHAAGMGNAKLKDLDPAMQAHFHYDAAKSTSVEKQFATNNALYYKYVSSIKPPAPVQETALDSSDDFIAPKIYARSIRGQAPPPFVIEQWLTPAPDIKDKFVLIDFWATWCGPCRRSIPELNFFFQKYHDRLAIIGISDEPASAVLKMTDPHIDYAIGVDTQGRMAKTLAITGIPHCILIDPHGIVRYEGMPGYLDEQKFEHLLAKYR